MRTTVLINKLFQILTDLEFQASNLDNNNDKLKAHVLLQDSSLFSKDLFNTRSDLFIDYIYEIKNKVNQLERLLKNNNEEVSKYQIELIEKQISALNNAFQSNHNLHKEAQNRLNAIARRKHKKAIKAIIKPSKNLYQSLAEHHDFERRLLDMVLDKEQEYKQLNNCNSAKTSQDLLVLHQRLGRCRKAISNIESDIIKLEANN